MHHRLIIRRLILRHGSCSCGRNGGAFWDTSGSVEAHSDRGLENADGLTEALSLALDVPQGKGKAVYRGAMKGHSLEKLWTKEHGHAFPD